MFACDKGELAALIQRQCAAAASSPAAPVTLECRRCLQKPSESDMRAAAAVMAPPAAMGVKGGGGGEWVLTDSAFHIGYMACDALVRLAAAHPEELRGVEVCAYGDMMQPLGTHADAAYLSRTDHVASVTSSVAAASSATAATTSASTAPGAPGAPAAARAAGLSARAGAGGAGGAAGSSAAAPAAAADDTSPAGRLRRARELVADALRGCPLLVLPLLPSRFVHVGTMPELLQHTAADPLVLAALPAAHAGVNLGTWDVAAGGNDGGMGGLMSFHTLFIFFHLESGRLTSQALTCESRVCLLPTGGEG